MGFESATFCPLAQKPNLQSHIVLYNPIMIRYEESYPDGIFSMHIHPSVFSTIYMWDLSHPKIWLEVFAHLLLVNNLLWEEEAVSNWLREKEAVKHWLGTVCKRNSAIEASGQSRGIREFG